MLPSLTCSSGQKIEPWRSAYFRILVTQTINTLYQYKRRYKHL